MDGDTLIVVNLDGAPFDTGFEVVRAIDTVGGVFSVVRDGAAASETWRVTLSGTPTADEIWRLLLTVGGLTNGYQYVVPAGGVSVQTIADALALELSAALGGNWLVTSTPAGAAAEIEIVKLTAGIFRVGFEIQRFSSDTGASAASVLLAGAPETGDRWTVSIDGVAATTYSVIAELFPGIFPFRILLVEAVVQSRASRLGEMEKKLKDLIGKPGVWLYGADHRSWRHGDQLLKYN